MPLGSKLSPPLVMLYLALIAGLWLLLWRGLDGPWFWSLFTASFSVELAFRLVEWARRRCLRLDNRHESR